MKVFDKDTLKNTIHFKISHILQRDSFSKNVITLLTGTTLAQAIPIAVAPILTRIYTPDDFGLFALYVAISSIVGIMATGRYELTIMLPKNERDAANLFIVSILVTHLVSLVLLGVVFFFNRTITRLLGNPEISFWLYFVPLSVLLTGIYQSLNYWSNRKKQYKYLAVNRIIQNSTMSCSQLAAGFSGYNCGGLISGSIIGLGAATISLGIKLFKEDKTIFFNTTKQEKITIAHRYINFPRYLIFAHLLNSASFQSPNILLNMFFGSSTAGFYMLTRRVISVPMSIVARAIGDIFRQEASHEFIHKGQCIKVFYKTLKLLFLIAVLPFTIFYFIAPDLFAFIFGEQWRIAGKYAQILTPMVFFQFITSPLSLMFMVAEKQRLDLIWQIILFLTTSSSLAIGYFFESTTCALVLFSGSYSIMYIISVIMSARFARGNQKSINSCRLL
jgi:O-antigen/teichoic acid export membrane protein